MLYIYISCQSQEMLKIIVVRRDLLEFVLYEPLFDVTKFTTELFTPNAFTTECKFI